MRALVVGAGPGGCTAGIALARRGIDTVVIEIEREVRPVGVGLALQNSPLRALDTLGLAEACVARGFVHPTVTMCDAAGRELATIEHRSLLPGKPAAVALSRAALAEILLDSLRGSGAELRLGTTVDELHDDGGAVDVRFSDGRADRFDVVVAADGLHSRTRRMLLPDAPEPRTTGQRIWRAAAARPPEVDRYWMLDGGPALGKVGLVPIGEDAVYLWLLQTDAGAERPPPTGCSTRCAPNWPRSVDTCPWSRRRCGRRWTCAASRRCSCRRRGRPVARCCSATRRTRPLRTWPTASASRSRTP